MPRAKKDAKLLNIKLATPVYDRLDDFCEETGMSKTVAAEKIFTHFYTFPHACIVATTLPFCQLRHQRAPESLKSPA